jgi:uncharacterized protein YqeY
MLREQIEKDFIEAYKRKDTKKVSILRLIKSAIKNTEINEQKTLDEIAIVNLLKKEVKQRETSIEEYLKGGRADLAAKETAEIEIIKTYLPEQISEADLSVIIKDTITELGATEMKDMGKVIAAVIAKTNGRADNGVVARIIRESLQK